MRKVSLSLIQVVSRVVRTLQRSYHRGHQMNAWELLSQRRQVVRDFPLKQRWAHSWKMVVGVHSMPFVGPVSQRNRSGVMWKYVGPPTHPIGYRVPSLVGNWGNWGILGTWILNLYESGDPCIIDNTVKRDWKRFYVHKADAVRVWKGCLTCKAPHPSTNLEWSWLELALKKVAFRRYQVMQRL